jgi:ATP-dependent Zn protease
LGGRVAEELVFDEISTGAQNDLQRASDIARAMVTEYGMSDRLGLVSYERPRQAMFLPESFSSGKNYSEAKAARLMKRSRGLSRKPINACAKSFRNGEQSLMILARLEDFRQKSESCKSRDLTDRR